MKILTIAATPFFSNRGGHMRIYNEAKYLGELGAKVRLCTYYIGEDAPGLDIRRIGKSGWYKKLSPGFHWGKIWLDLKLLFLTRKEIKNFQPDVIHAHLYEGLAVGYLAKKMAFRKIPIVFDLQGNIDEEFKSYSRKNSTARKFFVWLSKKIIKWADRIAVSSENVICRCPTPTIIIKDGIDLDLFENPHNLSEEEQKKIEKIREWTRGSKLLAYIGGLSDNKGVGNLLEAFLKLGFEEFGASALKEKAELPKDNWKLLLGGFGEDEQKYKKYISENNLESLVYFAGKVRYFSLPAYLTLADAGIDPKKGSTESSGKIVNLMAAKLPIVCFESEFNRARLGSKGYYLKTFDELSEILANVKKGQKIDYDLENLSEEKEVKKLYDIFNSAIK